MSEIAVATTAAVGTERCSCVLRYSMSRWMTTSIDLDRPRFVLQRQVRHVGLLAGEQDARRVAIHVADAEDRIARVVDALDGFFGGHLQADRPAGRDVDRCAGDARVLGQADFRQRGQQQGG